MRFAVRFSFVSVRLSSPQAAVRNFPLHMLSPGLLTDPASTAMAMQHLERWEIGRLVVQHHESPRAEQRNHLGGLEVVFRHNNVSELS